MDSPTSSSVTPPFFSLSLVQLPSLILPSTWFEFLVLVVACVFLLNIRSWPFAYHVRLFLPAIPLRVCEYAIKFRYIFSPSHVKYKHLLTWGFGKSPIGANPFEYTVSYQSRATIDDCDFYLHMSNSSYAKALDVVWMKAFLKSFLIFAGAGGWMPLAGNYVHFIKEIPAFSRYEIRRSIATWDGKWIYFVSKFVTKRSRSSKATTPPVPEKGHDHLSIPMPPSSGSSAPQTPLPSDANTSPDELLRAASASLSSLDEDDVILHAIAISKCCFKLGRITVPPAIVMATSGFAAPNKTNPYSSTNPPPHMQPFMEMVEDGWKYDGERCIDFFRGDWRRTPEHERWWEMAFKGLEQERIARLDKVNRMVATINELGH